MFIVAIQVRRVWTTGIKQVIIVHKYGPECIGSKERRGNLAKHIEDRKKREE